MGGDHTIEQGRFVAWWGSPPHGRGPPGPRHARRGARGLTPAWAGTTPSTREASGSVRAHPRMGGDHSGRRPSQGCGLGSPPHGRGPLIAAGAFLDGGGLTPAWAGTTHHLMTSQPIVRAHPRMGGDHAPSDDVPADRAGSPPHGRGPPFLGVGQRGADGLTPAWAGTTSQWCPSLLQPRAHPRMGGDHVPSAGIGPMSSGSPPHGRGPHRVAVLRDLRRGLTPAWAGTTHDPHLDRHRRWAHPRMGGDHSTMPCRVR